MCECEIEKAAILFSRAAGAAGVFIKKYLKINGVSSPDEIEDDDLRKVIDAYDKLNESAEELGFTEFPHLFD